MRVPDAIGVKPQARVFELLNKFATIRQLFRTRRNSDKERKRSQACEELLGT